MVLHTTMHIKQIHCGHISPTPDLKFIKLHSDTPSQAWHASHNLVWMLWRIKIPLFILSNERSSGVHQISYLMGVGAIFPWVKRSVVKMTTPLGLVQRLRINGDITPLYHTHLWRAKAQLMLLPCTGGQDWAFRCRASTIKSSIAGCLIICNHCQSPWELKI